MELQFSGLITMQEMYLNCIFLLEHGGIGLFYEFYHNKTVRELLGTKGSILCGNNHSLVVRFL